MVISVCVCVVAVLVFDLTVCQLESSLGVILFAPTATC